MENIFNVLSNLVDSDNENSSRISKFLLEYEKDYQLLKVSDIAKAAYTSEATVTRFSKQIGYIRFAELRLALIRDKDLYYGLDSDNIDSGYFENHYSSVVSSLENTKDLNMLEEIEDFVDKIIKAKVINIFAMGETGVVAKDFQLKLIRIGFNANYDLDKHTQHFTASNSDKDTLSIGISYSGKTTEVIDNLKLSKEYGSTTCLICSKMVLEQDFVDKYLRVYANESISRVFSTTSRFSLLFLLDIIYHQLINRDIKYYKEKLDKTRMIRKG